MAARITKRIIFCIIRHRFLLLQDVPPLTFLALHRSDEVVDGIRGRLEPVHLLAQFLDLCRCEVKDCLLAFQIRILQSANQLLDAPDKHTVTPAFDILRHERLKHGVPQQLMELIGILLGIHNVLVLSLLLNRNLLPDDILIRKEVAVVISGCIHITSAC